MSDLMIFAVGSLATILLAGGLTLTVWEFREAGKKIEKLKPLESSTRANSDSQKRIA